ncbi:ankyrin repeat-containing protein [Planoprotostelium fungivorum]|uniref:Ankyrin repeat-containing protein n=1 Tax=Planoprotostelium fungivorum TaxID=1890364 RepID=A0A2P6N047_9EUKA|nr:ankyrin repeat-containing protein [Planoprotostelium fungivorum]
MSLSSISPPPSPLTSRRAVDSDEEKQLLRAVCRANTSFDFYDTTAEFYEKLLSLLVDLTESSFGYACTIETKGIESKSPIQAVAAIDKRSSHSSAQTLREIITLMDDETNTVSASVTSRQVNLQNGRSIIKGNNVEILLQNTMMIPLFRPPRKGERDGNRELIAIMGVGERNQSFTPSYLASLRPFVKTCEMLITSHHNQVLLRKLQGHGWMQELALKMKRSETGIPTKDRKLMLKTYKNCFTGKDVVSWLLEHAEDPEGRTHTREDAVKLGAKLMSNGYFYPFNKSGDFVDDSMYYSFDPVESLKINVAREALGSYDDLGSVESGNTTPRKARAGMKNFRRFSLNATEASFLSRGPLKDPDAERIKLHTIVVKKDLTSLRKKLTKKKVIDVLIYPNENGQSALQLAITESDPVAVEMIVQCFIANKLDINGRDARGRTALHCAIESASERMVAAVLTHPTIDVNIKDDNGCTPLHTFCRRYYNPSSIEQTFRELIDKGARINEADEEGETPLHVAIYNKAIRAILTRLLLDSGAELNVGSSDGQTPLNYAIQLGRKDLVHMLLSRGANPNFRAKSTSKTGLEQATECGNEEINSLVMKCCDLSQWLDSIEMGKWLPVLIKELIFKDILFFVEDRILLEAGVSLAGDRLRILQAIEKLKKEELERRINPDASPKTPQTPKGRMRLSDLRKRFPSPNEKVSIPDPVPMLSFNSEMENFRSLPENTSVEWIPPNQLEFTELLGSGNSGEVFRGFYNGQEVAIKVLERDGVVTKLEEFKHEFKVMSAIRGDTIVRFFGASIEPKPSFVMEYCSRGSVYDLLRDSKVLFGWDEMIRFSYQMVQAIHLLHSNNPQILHRDIKTMNFLVTQSWFIKACDFGLSRFLSGDNMNTFYQVRGTMSYIAPETYLGNKFTTSSDVYSLGMVMWEMMHRAATGQHRLPFSEYEFITQPIQILVQSAQHNLRPSLPSEPTVPPELKELVTACWDADPSKRPTTEQLMKTLAELRRLRSGSFDANS